MKYTISQASRIIGVTRKTFYKHIEKRGISKELDENGNTLIDASELIRVYGDKCDFDQADLSKETATHTDKEQGSTRVVTVNTDADILILQEKLNAEKARIELLENQLQREKEINEELSRALHKAQDTNKLLLIEDKNKEENRVGEWEKVFQSLEKSVEDRKTIETTLKAQVDKALLENKRLKNIATKQKRAIQQEKEKGIFKKLFG